MDRVEENIGESRIDDLVMNGQNVAQRLAGLVVEQTVDLLEVRRGDLLNIFGDLDLRNDLAVLVFNGCKFVNAAEYRLGLGGDEPLADAERVYAGF